MAELLSLIVHRQGPSTSVCCCSPSPCNLSIDDIRMGQVTSTPVIPTQNAATCPIKHDTPAPAKCPILHEQLEPPARCPMKENEASRPAACPIDHRGSAVNPHNQMPTLSQAPAPLQSISLPTNRTESSIPRDHDGKWEYPSPQQFYNALVRKGWETPEEHVETMVHIHNFLNEEAWEEVKKWECKRTGDSDAEDIYLARFKGRPGEMSPKARFWMLAGWLLPDRFNTEPPFDRHDWIIRRPKTGEEVRYVIDYYSAPPEPDGSPVFSLDVRPALDSFGSVKARISALTGEVWTEFRNGNQPGGESK